MFMWQIHFFPPSGERYSPYDFVVGLPRESDAAAVIHRLESMRKMEMADWPSAWVHKLVGKIYQLKVGAFRLMYCLDRRTIVVLHACRKKGQRTKPQDLERAETHYRRYFTQREDD
jgi:phage-related protein